MKKVLITAYSVNPFKGSEDGMGWNFSLQAAKNNKVTVITRKNNRDDIERYIKEKTIDDSNLSFKYYDLPYWMRFWKRKSKGAMVYYYMWQIGVAFKALRLKLNVDLVHNLNFHNDWTPSFLWMLGKPMVWGPVGHHPDIKLSYLNRFGIKAKIQSKFRWFIKNIFWKADPFLRLTRMKAKRILVMSSKAEVGVAKEGRVITLPSVASELPKINYPKSKEEFHVLSVGRLVPLKGFDLAIKAYAKFYHDLPAGKKLKTSFTIVGRGILKSGLEHLIDKYELRGKVKIVDWVERKKLKEFYVNSHVFLFPSHEGAGMVVSEAMSYKMPVICLDNCGPGEFVSSNSGIKVSYEEYDQSIKEMATGLKKLMFIFV